MRELLANFVRVKPKLEKKDIGQYKTVQELQTVVDALKDTDLRSEKEKERDYKNELFSKGEAELIFRAPDLIVIKLNSERASCYFGTNTKWCTAAAKDNRFSIYNKKGPLLVFIYQKKKYQLHITTSNGKVEFRDETNKTINNSLKYEILGLYHELLNKVDSYMPKSKRGKIVRETLIVNAIRSGTRLSDEDRYAHALPYSIEYASKVIKGRWRALEKILLDPNVPSKYSNLYFTTVAQGNWPAYTKRLVTDVDSIPKAIDYVKNVLKARMPSLEKLIIKNPGDKQQYVLQYAIASKNRWKASESILSDPDTVLQYARRVIKGPFPEKEDIILAHPEHVIGYSEKVIGGRWPEGEDAIARSNNKDLVIRYGMYLVKGNGRWPAGERVILNSGEPGSIVFYAEYVIKGRWPEAEPQLLESNSVSDIEQYASNVIKGRWPEAEEQILTKGLEIARYARRSIKGRWPKGERALLSKVNDYEAGILNYSQFLLKSRWPEAEKLLTTPRILVAYAKDVMKTRWIEKEDIMKQDSSHFDVYKQHFNLE